MVEAKKIIKNTDKYRALFMSSRDAIMTLEPPLWKFSSGNPATVLMFKAKDEADFLSYQPWELSPMVQPDGRNSGEKAKEMILQAMESGSAFFEWTHRRLDGSDFPAEVLLSKVEQDGEVYLQALVRDITERKKVEKRLKKTESRFRSYFRLPLCGIAITSPEKGWIEVNDKLCAMLGYSREEITKMTWAEMTHPDDLPRDIEQFENILSGKIESYILDKRFICKNKDIIWTRLSVGCVRKPEGMVDYTVALLFDMTEEKKVEEGLKKTREDLEMRLDELKKMNELMINRELKMIELKDRIKELEKGRQKI